MVTANIQSQLGFNGWKLLCLGLVSTDIWFDKIHTQIQLKLQPKKQISWLQRSSGEELNT